MANAKGHFSGSSETVLDNDVSILFKGGGPNELLDALRQQVGRTSFEASDFVGRSSRNPLFPVVYLALKQRGAKDWQSGLGISLTHSGKVHCISFHHIFPKSLLPAAGYEGSEINEIANLAIISGSANRSLSNKPPSVYFPDVVEKRGEEALTSQCIPTDEQLWLIENYRQFLETRRANLARVLNDFFAEIASDHRPPIDVRALIEAGESGTLEFKSSARYNQHSGGVDKNLESVVVKTVAAFMNSDGGTLLIGVNDSGFPIGVGPDLQTLNKKDLDGYELFLTGLLAGSIGVERLPQVSVFFHSIENVDVCLVRVGAAPRPAYVTEGAERRLYIRTGNSSRPLTTEEAVDYVQHRWP
jgi:hypothetical protein